MTIDLAEPDAAEPALDPAHEALRNDVAMVSLGHLLVGRPLDWLEMPSTQARLSRLAWELADAFMRAKELRERTC